MTRPLRLSLACSLPSLVLVTGCFNAGSGDDEVGGSTDDTTGESADTDTTATTDDTTTDDTTTDETDETDDTTTGPMCSPDETACGNDCVDVQTDAAHCGACGHDCLGGNCILGTCEAVELASGKGRLMMVQVDADYIYYGGDGVDVGRIGKDGSNDTILVPAGADIQLREWCYDSTITSTAVVWGNDWVQPGVRGCMTPDCAGGVQTFAGDTNMYALAYDRDNDVLYWHQGADIVRMTWPGGSPTEFTAGQGGPRELAAADGFIYWATSLAANDFHLRKRDVDSGPMVDLVIDRPTMGAIAVGPSMVYWAEDAQIYSAPLPNGIGGGAPTAFGSSGGSVYRMAIDDTHLYWTSNSGDVGSVQRCPLDGCAGAPEILAQVTDPWGITLDDVAAYFVTEAGSLYKIAK